MSRAYRIEIKECLTRHINAGDKVEGKIELLNILPAERMQKLLSDDLAGRGFEVDGNVAKQVCDDGIEVIVDLTTGAVEVQVAKGTDLDISKKGEVTVYDDVNSEPTVDRAKAELRKTLEREVREKTEQLQGEVTKKLEHKASNLQLELDDIANRITSAALKEKAAQLGEIEEISEDVDTGAVSIRVRV